MKLRNRIHIYSTLLTLVILILLTVIIYYSFSSLTYSTEVDELDSAADAMLGAYNASTVNNPSDILRGYVPVQGLIRVSDREGGQLELIQSPDVTTQFPAAPGGRSGTLMVEGERFAYTTTPMIWPDGAVVELLVAKSLREVSGNLDTLRLVLAAAVFLAMIPVIISGAFLARIVTRPITALTDTMKNIQQNGRFEKLPISEKSTDELNQMGMTFNDMMSLLEENYLKQEEFVSNASHELKTPLTIIGSYAKLLERQGMENRDVAEESITAIRSETSRMSTLIDQLLMIARRSESIAEIEQIDLTALLSETTAALRRSYDRDFILQTDDKPMLVETDPAKLKQLLYILLDNARKYSSESIEISASRDELLTIHIRDYGEGIPKESLPFVFDRFYRVDQARNRGTGGFGLGLALAKQLADVLNLKLDIESIENLGTTIIITFSSDFNVPEVKSDEEGSL